MKPAVVISGYTAGLSAIRGLGAMGVPVIVARYDPRDMGWGSRYVREQVHIPHPDSAADRVLEILAGVASRYPGALLIAASDPAISTVARHQNDLAAMGFVVASATEIAALTFLDKAATYALAEEQDVPVPTTVVATTTDDLERFLEVGTFPAVLKPALSHRYYEAFGRKWTRVDSMDHAIEAFTRARELGLEVSLQELIPGDELCGANYNSYSVDGIPAVEFTARKIRNSPPESGSPSVARSEHVPEVVEYGRRLLKAATFEGFSCMEFKRDPRDGVYKLIEVNGRHNLSGMLALHCGVNFAWLQYRHLMLGQPPEQASGRSGVYWVDITRDLKDAGHYLRRPDYSVWRFLRPYMSPHVFAVLSMRDPRPALIRAVDTARMLATNWRAGG